MPELLAVVTRKGQVTIPAELRDALDLKRGDLVEFTLPDPQSGSATVRRVPGNAASRTDQLFGSLRSPVPALSREEERRAFEEGTAEEVESLLQDPGS